MMTGIRCACCGHFIAHPEMESGGGARFHFEPDSHLGPEISEWECADCIIGAAQDAADEAALDARNG